MIRFVPWSEVGTITVEPGDNVIEVGAFVLAEGADTLWVRMTNTGTPGPWPWSYGILSFKTEEGQPLGSIKAYNSFDGEVFRLGVGLPPSVRSGVLTFEPRGFNLAWIRQGNPWPLKFEAQSGRTGGVMTSYWNRDPVNGVLSPVTAGDDVVLGLGDMACNSVNVASDKIKLNANGTVQLASGLITTYPLGSADFNGGINIGGDDAPVYKIQLGSDGTGVFTGNVTAPNITFRSTNPDYYLGRLYTGPELDLLEEIKRLETLLAHLYEVLRITPPAGWEVWDGSEDDVVAGLGSPAVEH